MEQAGPLDRFLAAKRTAAAEQRELPQKKQGQEASIDLTEPSEVRTSHTPNMFVHSMLSLGTHQCNDIQQ